MNEKDWAKIFRALGNENRIKIIKMVMQGRHLTVSQIQERLGISFKWTSFNLNNLKRVGILESAGKANHVFYYLKPNLPKLILDILNKL